MNFAGETRDHETSKDTDMTSTNPSAPPLNLPYYNAPFGEAVARFWKKYATFSGRASRAEFWWWYLVGSVVNLIFQALSFAFGGFGIQPDGTMSPPSVAAVIVFVLWGLWALATLVPSFAVLARRLHDGNFSAAWIFIALVPFVGGIILLVLTVLPANPAGTRFDR